MNYDIHRATAKASKGWLLLVHGLLSSRNHWMLNLPALTAEYDVIAVDLPAHGLSKVPEGPDGMHPDRMVARLEEIRQENGIERWYLCGQSFGAGVTLRYALLHPERVPAQVFTNARSVLRDESNPQEQADRSARAERIRTGGMEAFREERFHPRYAKRFPEAIKRQLEADAEGIDLAGYLQILDSALRATSLRDCIREITVPTLLINGRHERLFQPVRAELEEVWPELEITDIDGGHSVNIENVEGFDQAALGFFARYPMTSVEAD